MARPIGSPRPAWRAMLKAIRRQAAKHFATDPRLTVSAWAARHLVLPREESPEEPGQFDPARNPAFVEIMDAMGDPDVREVVVCCASQVGKTFSLLAATLAGMAQEPVPTLFVMPTLELARSFALERFAPTVRSCRVLDGKVYDPASRDSNSTMLARRFAGATLWLTGANSAASLASRPVVRVIGDEVDRWPITLAGEGSPVSLAWKRAARAAGRKLVLTSSPTIRGVSIIWDWFERGDQRHYHVPCLHCGARWPIRWANIRWDKDAEGQHLPETAALWCPVCGGVHHEADKRALLQAGTWVPTYPDRRIRSYHANALASPFFLWEDVVREFLEAKRSRPTMQVFSNTVLAECTEPDEEPVVTDTRLADRLERYAADVPDGVRLILAGVDVQDNRLAVSLWGFGAGEEMWLLSHEELMGSPGENGVWAELDQRLTAEYARADGTTLPVYACGIDTGGHHTAAVYSYASPRQGRSRGRVIAFKGHKQPGAAMLPAKPSAANRQGVRLWSYGTNTAKDELFGRLEIGTPGPKYVHLVDTVDREYLQQLVGETPHIEFKNGQRRRVYRKLRARTEGLDCAMYALLALHTFGPAFVRRQLTAPAAEATEALPAVEPQAEVVELVPTDENVGVNLILNRVKRWKGQRPQTQRDRLMNSPPIRRY